MLYFRSKERAIQLADIHHKPRDDVYGPYDSSYLQSNQSHGPTTHTQSPVVTGTSVIALKFKDGVVIAADNLGTSLTSSSFIHLLSKSS